MSHVCAMAEDMQVLKGRDSEDGRKDLSSSHACLHLVASSVLNLILLIFYFIFIFPYVELVDPRYLVLVKN